MTRPVLSQQPGRPGTTTLRHLALALAAGALFVGYLRARPPMYTVPKEHVIVALAEPKEKWDKYLSEQRRVDRGNARADFAVLGLLLTAAFAVGRCRCQHPVRRFLASLPAGALAGLVTGAVGCWAHQHWLPYGEQGTVELTARVHSVLFGTLGLTVGLVIGVLQRSLLAAAGGSVAGALGGALAGAAYAVLVSLILPAANVQPLVPPALNSQLLWLGLGTGLIALTAPVGWGPSSTPCPSQAEPEAGEPIPSVLPADRAAPRTSEQPT